MSATEQSATPVTDRLKAVDGADACWLNDDTRDMLAELNPKPDQVTLAINTDQMNPARWC